MTDHIPLSEARPGDIVHLKPLKIIHINPNSIEALLSTGRFEFLIKEIDHIERAPRVLKVGDRVRLPSRGTNGTIEALHAPSAWVLWDGMESPWTEDLTDLEPLND